MRRAERMVRGAMGGHWSGQLTCADVAVIEGHAFDALWDVGGLSGASSQQLAQAIELACKRWVAEHAAAVRAFDRLAIPSRPFLIAERENTSELAQALIGKVRAFDAQCKAGEHTDTGQAWELLHLIELGLNALVIPDKPKPDGCNDPRNWPDHPDADCPTCSGEGARDGGDLCPECDR